MQFHLNGFHAGDPTIAIPAAGVDDRPAFNTSATAEVDVLIVGSGPAGLMLSAYLSQFPEISTRIIEQREGPLVLGQADGIACRTVETFEAFGLASQLLQESYYVTETSFWRPDTSNRTDIVRTGLIRDVEDGLSEFPHVIVNQARINDYLLGFMQRSATRLVPDYGWEFAGLETDRTDAHPVLVTMRSTAGELATVRAKYVVGADGARSGVRKAIGRTLNGESAGHAWGVMDVLAVSDFPDFRVKAAIQSEAGSILLIPREGGYLVRIYVDLGTVTDDNRAEVRGKSKEQLVEAASRVLHPYSLDVKDTIWWSIYEVAQRVTDGFDDVAGRDGQDPRVFIAGDACHTHSAKAGQGMNVSMQDALNLGWKLSAVLRGAARPELLETYSTERVPVAERLIAFDKEWSAMMAAPPKDPAHSERGGVDPDELQEYFVSAGRYTAGVATQYTPSTLTGSDAHQQLASGFEVGTRFHSSPATRIADARHLELGHVHRADGRWRLYAFSGADESALAALCDWLEKDPASPIVRHTPEGDDIDAVIDVRGILQRPHREVEVGELPSLLRPRKGRFGLVDHEKAFSSITRGADLFDARGVDRDQGAIVLVRPDQYVAQVLPLTAREELSEFFGGFLA
ncbi:phenol 2-monooxygenase [Microbacterium sp. CH12i]|uniref:FAD-dependent monooxygenase n=1 Tax=Microbacterium sp. CH12i TaxID=1479651 RepID=UPI000461793F|nr:FAD-dependent monooxygenase [Microbacterium sp. CH12i]KDA06858.1 phenol 2-monooxygenase [Microbacterium sp. CH12i]